MSDTQETCDLIISKITQVVRYVNINVNGQKCSRDSAETARILSEVYKNLKQKDGADV